MTASVITQHLKRFARRLFGTRPLQPAFQGSKKHTRIRTHSRARA